MTLQAPQTPMLQPSLVPVKPILSRRTCSSSRLDSISTSCSSPFTFRVICFFILPVERICDEDLAGPTRQSIIEHLDERVANEADYKDNHRNSNYFSGVKLSAVSLRERAEADKGDEHLTIDYSLYRAPYAEADAGEHQR